jgi:hypothetical protein
MSKHCDHCYQSKSQGSLGMLRLCYDCIATLAQKPRKFFRVRRAIQLTNQGAVQSYAEWVPDAALSRERRPSGGPR